LKRRFWTRPHGAGLVVEGAADWTPEALRAMVMLAALDGRRASVQSAAPSTTRRGTVRDVVQNHLFTPHHLAWSGPSGRNRIHPRREGEGPQGNSRPSGRTRRARTVRVTDGAGGRRGLEGRDLRGTAAAASIPGDGRASLLTSAQGSAAGDVHGDVVRLRRPPTVFRASSRSELLPASHQSAGHPCIVPT